MKKTLQEWLKYFEDNSDYPNGWNKPGPYPKGSKMFWDPEKGYVVLIRDEETKMLVVVEVCGEVKHWVELAVAFAKQLNFDKVGGKFGKHIKPYLKDLGAEVVKINTDENGLSRYVCKDKDNHLVLASEGIEIDKKIYNCVPVKMHTIILYLDKKVEV